MCCQPLDTTCGYHTGVVTEQLECQAVNAGGNAAAGSAKAKPVFDIAMTAEVAPPLLQLSQQTVMFSYIHTDSQQLEVMTEQLGVR